MAEGTPGKCDSCGAVLPQDQLVEIGGKTVCAACKADAVLSLKSGVPMSGNRVSPAEAEAIRKKLRTLNLLSFAFALPGMALVFGGNAMRAGGNEAGVVLTLLGTVLFMVGLGLYARMKGRSGALALLGFLSCIGLLLLYFFSKVCHHCKATQSYRAKECSGCGAPL